LRTGAFNRIAGGCSDRNADGTISFVELGGFAKQRTKEASVKLGNTQTPLIINFGKDGPVYRLR